MSITEMYWFLLNAMGCGRALEGWTILRINTCYFQFLYLESCLLTGRNRFRIWYTYFQSPWNDLFLSGQIYSIFLMISDYVVLHWMEPLRQVELRNTCWWHPRFQVPHHISPLYFAKDISTMTLFERLLQQSFLVVHVFFSIFKAHSEISKSCC